MGDQRFADVRLAKSWEPLNSELGCLGHKSGIPVLGFEALKLPNPKD